MTGSLTTALSVLTLAAVCAGAYVLPLLIGWARHVPHLGSIAAVNILLGWTAVGWVVALAMALRTTRPAGPVIQLVQQLPPGPPPPGWTPPGPPMPGWLPPGGQMPGWPAQGQHPVGGSQRHGPELGWAPPGHLPPGAPRPGGAPPVGPPPSGPGPGRPGPQVPGTQAGRPAGQAPPLILPTRPAGPAQGPGSPADDDRDDMERG